MATWRRASAAGEVGSFPLQQRRLSASAAVDVEAAFDGDATGSERTLLAARRQRQFQQRAEPPPSPPPSSHEPPVAAEPWWRIRARHVWIAAPSCCSSSASVIAANEEWRDAGDLRLAQRASGKGRCPRCRRTRRRHAQAWAHGRALSCAAVVHPVSPGRPFIERAQRAQRRDAGRAAEARAAGTRGARALWPGQRRRRGAATLHACRCAGAAGSGRG